VVIELFVKTIHHFNSMGENTYNVVLSKLFLIEVLREKKMCVPLQSLNETTAETQTGVRDRVR